MIDVFEHEICEIRFALQVHCNLCGDTYLIEDTCNNKVDSDNLKDMRRDGWVVDVETNEALCPDCVGKLLVRLSKKVEI